MLSTGFPQFWGWFALGLAGFATVVAFSAVAEARKMAKYVQMCTDWMHENNSETYSASRMAAFDKGLTELSDHVSSLEASHKRLRSKYGMRDLRERRKESDDDEYRRFLAKQGELDLSTTQDKRALRLELRKKGLLK